MASFSFASRTKELAATAGKYGGLSAHVKLYGKGDTYFVAILSPDEAQKLANDLRAAANTAMRLAREDKSLTDT